MRSGALSGVLTLAFLGGTAAQTFATSEQPYPDAAPAPAYQAYEPTVFNAEAYEAATQPSPPLPVAPTQGEIVYETVPYDAGNAVPYVPAQPAPLAAAPVLQPSGGEIVYQPSPNDPSLGDNLSLPLGSPETFAAPESEPSGELGFSQETETSRLLIALEETYSKRVTEMKASHLAQRRAMLAAFEKEAEDPEKVIGLAGRMRAGLSELEAAQKAALAEEERQYTAAMLSVLDKAPSRAE